MYVRWINRPRKKQRTVHWAAVLVENKWIDGRPTQQHLAYLGGITQADARSAAKRAELWAKATALLDGLGEQVATERAKIEAALAARVPRPTKREQRRKAPPAEPPHILALRDQIHDLEIELEEEEERARL
jgi:hypothetical protein